MEHFKRYLVTSALPYANGPLHIGQIAGAYLPADIYVRYLRLQNKDVVYVCGSDEHGVPITLRAREEGVSPQDIVDRYHKMNEEDFKRLGIDFDIYHRTSSKLHHETASAFFTTLHEKGEFTEKESEQYFDEEHQQFLADRYIIGTCPICGNENAYGDQCENCGSSLSPRELKNPRSALSGKTPAKKKTRHWYLPLDKYQGEWLEEWIRSHEKDWKPNVYGQCLSWLDQGLKARAVTRDLDWGVKVPLEAAKDKVLYVWFDAPIGYISATKAWASASGKDWKPYWQDKDTRLLHFIGKDNIVFHCIIFPALLKAHGDYIVPDNVPSMEFLNLEGDKISTSKNRAVWLNEYLEDLPGKEDTLRYVLCANMPENKDNDFTWKDYQARHNNELVAILGNFVNRVFVLSHKYFQGDVLEAGGDLAKWCKENGKPDLQQVRDNTSSFLEQFKFRRALSEMMSLARLGNLYLTEREPWKNYESDPAGVKQVLSECLQITANLAILLAPVLPFTSQKLIGMLHVGDDFLQWDNLAKPDLLPAGHKIGEAELLFDKIEDELIESQIDKLKATLEASEETKTTNTKSKPMIKFEDFQKLELRSGTILTAEKVENADKLIQMTVDIGTEKRIIVSGIAEHFEPADLLDRQVSVLTNLAPRKIKGIESQGMILLAENSEGKMALVAPDVPMEDGSEIS